MWNIHIAEGPKILFTIRNVEYKKNSQNKQFSLQNNTVGLYKKQEQQPNNCCIAKTCCMTKTVWCQVGLLMKQQLLELKSFYGKNQSCTAK